MEKEDGYMSVLWSVFLETGDPMCYLLCKAGEKEGESPEIIPIPEEFKMNPPGRSAPTGPR